MLILLSRCDFDAPCRTAPAAQAAADTIVSVCIGVAAVNDGNRALSTASHTFAAGDAPPLIHNRIFLWFHLGTSISLFRNCTCGAAFSRRLRIISGTMSGDGELMLTILASLAQEESRSVSENCKWRVRKKFEQGIPSGLRMYGYDVRNGSFTIRPEEAEVVRRIFRMYLDGMGSERIMRVLNAEDVPAPEGGLWNAGTIMMMLRNEKYAGDLLLQKSYVNNHVEKKQLPNRGELPQYFVAEDHAPIIDMETFDAVQAEIAGRRELHTAKAADAVKRPDMPLGDRIICGICGKKYRRKITRQGTPYAAPVWICATFNYRGKAFCASKQIPEQTLMELIAAALGESRTADDVDHIEMHPGNRVLFVFRDGHAVEHFWKDRSRRDSWVAERRKRAAEKTRAQRQRKEPIEQ